MPHSRPSASRSMLTRGCLLAILSATTHAKRRGIKTNIRHQRRFNAMKTFCAMNFTHRWTIFQLNRKRARRLRRFERDAQAYYGEALQKRLEIFDRQVVSDHYARKKWRARSSNGKTESEILDQLSQKLGNKPD